jgi:hypothetical protein
MIPISAVSVISFPTLWQHFQNSRMRLFVYRPFLTTTNQNGVLYLVLYFLPLSLNFFYVSIVQSRTGLENIQTQGYIQNPSGRNG